MNLYQKVMSEEELERNLFNILINQGISCKRQVKVRSGIIDILTPQAIIEVKLHLSRDSIRKGMGQLLTFREDLQPAKVELILIGYETRDTIHLVAGVNRVGINMVAWRGGFEVPSPAPLYYTVPKSDKRGKSGIVRNLMLPFEGEYFYSEETPHMTPYHFMPITARLRPQADILEILNQAMVHISNAGLWFMEKDTMRRMVGNREFIHPIWTDDPEEDTPVTTRKRETRGRK